MMTGSLKKKRFKKKLKDFFISKKGGSLIRACSLIRSNTVYVKCDIQIERGTRCKKLYLTLVGIIQF